MGGKRRRDAAAAATAAILAEGRLHCDEADSHFKTGNFNKALRSYNKALQLNPEDRSALVARSRCYLLLGQPDRALEDAETALRQDKTFIRGVFQKAEALYHLGDFEHSLMFYHRGLRLRPEMTMFRLGVQKAQEAIENTIGREHLLTAKSVVRPSSARTSSARSSCARPSSTDPGFSNVSLATAPRIDAGSPKSVKKNQGSLAVDREYLEQLLKHPDLRVALRDNRTAAVSSQAESCVEYLRTRQEFWRQQKMADAAGGSPTERTPR